MVQAGPMAFRPVQLLRSQAGFWEAVAACVPDTLQRQLELEDEADPATAWAARSETAWRYAGENGALQLIALEAFLNPRPGPGTLSHLNKPKLTIKRVMNELSNTLHSDWA